MEVWSATLVVGAPFDRDMTLDVTCAPTGDRCLLSVEEAWGANGHTPKKRIGIAMSAEEARELREACVALKLGPPTNGALGCDGVTYTLRVSSGMSKWQIEWWGDLPPEWADADPLVGKLKLLIDRSLTSGDASS